MGRTLEEAGLQVWLDKSEILPGDNWADKLAEALRESEAMVVLLTPKALESSHVQWEISYALGAQTYRNRLIPVWAGNPDELRWEQIPWILKRFQIINLAEHANEAEGIRQIAHALLAAA